MAVETIDVFECPDESAAVGTSLGPRHFPGAAAKIVFIRLTINRQRSDVGDIDSLRSAEFLSMILVVGFDHDRPLHA